jgi:hypothetical protein
MTSQIFASPSEIGGEARGLADVPFGHVGGNGRYKMPLLSGDEAPKAKGADWVSGGVMRATNLASAIEDQKALNAWEQQYALRGLALDVSLYEELVILIREAGRAGATLDDPDLRDTLTGKPNDSKSHDASIMGRAKHLAGANIARNSGTNHHRVFEASVATGAWNGTNEMNDRIRAVHEMVDAAGFDYVPDLQERVIRNIAVGCAGRFDTVLISRRTGVLFMADLKTKRKPFKSWLTVDAQLAIYARAEWMLSDGDQKGRRQYLSGPCVAVDQARGIVLVCPSNGDAPYLRPADLATGWRTALLARQVVDLRNYSRSAERHAMTVGDW